MGSHDTVYHWQWHPEQVTPRVRALISLSGDQHRQNVKSFYFCQLPHKCLNSDKINLIQRELEVSCQVRKCTNLIGTDPWPGGVFQGDKCNSYFDSRSETRLFFGLVSFDILLAEDSRPLSKTCFFQYSKPDNLSDYPCRNSFSSFLSLTKLLDSLYFGWYSKVIASHAIASPERCFCS